MHFMYNNTMKLLQWFNVCASSTNLRVASSIDMNKMDGKSSNVIVSMP
jgi:hypothetical protein